MKSGPSKKKESWLGVVITLILCLGFLYWWFRPEPHSWQHENAGQLVARAMKEPRPQSRVEQQVIDFDLMEIAICQVGIKLVEDAMTTAKGIADPVIKQRAAKRLAQSYLHSDPKDLGRALTFADLLTDPSQHGAVRAEILAELAEAGFPDAALPEAKTALQKASLARRIAITGDSAKETARRLAVDAEKELPSLPKAEADAVRLEVAWAKVNLTLTDSPSEAIAAIEALPASEQGKLWTDLTLQCLSRVDAETCVPAVMQHIKDRDLKRKLEIDSLAMRVKLRPAADLIAECKAEADAAASPSAKVAALIFMADAQRAAESEILSPAADATLKAALAIARNIQNPAERCRALLTLTRKFLDPPLLGEARPILDEAAKDASLVESTAERMALLVLASEESYKQSDEPQAVKLMEDAARLVNGGSSGAGSLEMLALAVIRRGDWPRGLALIDRIPDETARAAALDRAADRAADDSVSMNPAQPPPRGAPVDDIRRQAAGDHTQVIALVEKQPAGYARARAWLAMAKGVIGPPVNTSADEPAKETAPLPAAPLPDK